MRVEYDLPKAVLIDVICYTFSRVMDFVKLITVQEVTRPGLERAASAIERLAAAEGLVAHAHSVRVR